MAGKSRISTWSIFRILVLPCLFLCTLFRKPVFQWVAVAMLIIWILFEVIRLVRRLPRRERKQKKGWEDWICPDLEPCQEEPADKSLLLQVNYRITEQLKITYPNISWLWLERPKAEELKRGGKWRISMTNADPFNYAEVSLSDSGAMEIDLLQIVSLQQIPDPPEPEAVDLSESDILERFDVKKWYQEHGEKVLCDIVEELHTQGYKKLRIMESGEVVIDSKNGSQPFETIADFPPKTVWSDLCALIREDDIQASVDGAQLALAW